MVTKEAEELTQICETLSNPYLEDWKKEGGKIVGYACTYVPEEIIHAAGMLPYRIRGTGCVGTSLADTWLTRIANCSFARSILELALTGEYDFLDGVVFNNGCDHTRRGFENWKAQQNTPSFMYMLPVPHVITDDGLQWYREEVNSFKDAMEQSFGIEIKDEKLKEAVKVYNETRSLLKQLYELRTQKNPPISGAETLKILLASVSMPREKFNQLLRELLIEIRSREGISDYRARLMLVGSINDDPELIELIEDIGGLVVTDSLCFGARFFWDLDEETGDPMDSITARYYYHIPCPRMYGALPQRLDFLMSAVKEAAVDGVILQSIKFCDLHGVENVLEQKALEKAGIPTLKIEREYGPLADTGRFRTRVQAFLEQIGK
ncbi:MAG TPA: 2-hydroxyacyl-CoA dehydratase [Dehalococcoidia bacterium]|nr:2-hydroxyacyl-CoA dehydratase [Dehalococcoidia bacterium]